MKKFFAKVRNYLIEKLRPLFREILGMKEYEEKIETLHELMNTYFDISEFPKATGPIRDLQLVATKLLQIFHEVCAQNDLVYWADYGTLLGAVRHKGFIPWDDDLDCAMPRDDYNKAAEIFPEIFGKLGFKVAITKSRIYICNWNAGVNLDIYAVDNVSRECGKSSDEIKEKITECRKVFKDKDMSQSKMDSVRIERIGSPSYEKDAIFFHNPYQGDKSVFNGEDIYPLKLV